jgi:cystathionine beta-lyase
MNTTDTPSMFDQLHERRSTGSVKWTTYPDDVLPLWVADMDFQSPEPIRAALHAAIDRGVLGYEFLTLRTKKIVAARMERLYGWQVDPDWITTTIGVVHGLNVAARAFCNPGDGVLLHTPAYNGFFPIYTNVGLTQQFTQLSYREDGNILRPAYDRESFLRAFHTNNARTRIFAFCHPHNPCGKVCTREELLEMAEIAVQNDAVILSDEIHSELLLENQKHIPVAQLSPEIADRTVTFISPSKTFNTAGLFCAFAIIPNNELRQRFQRTAEQLTGHVSSLSLIAAEVAFSGACDDWLAQLLPYLRANRDYVIENLKTHFPLARFTIPDATYLQWIDFSPYLASGVIAGSPHTFFLTRGKVALGDGKIYGEGFENCARLNFGTARSIVAEALERMSRAISTL